MNKSKLGKLDDAITRVEFARDRILPLSYDNEGMAKVQGDLLEARDALKEWFDVLTDPDKTVTGHEKEYIMTRLQRVRKYLSDQLDQYDGHFVEAEDAEEEIDAAIAALS